MGFPYQVVLGKRGVLAGEAEVKVRATGERLNMPFEELCAWLTGKIVPERS
jgi:prolyl-tRNA synthetase